MFVLLVILLFGGLCIGGWRYGKRRKCFDYDRLDCEIDALRRTIENQHE